MKSKDLGRSMLLIKPDPSTPSNSAQDDKETKIKTPIGRSYHHRQAWVRRLHVFFSCRTTCVNRSTVDKKFQNLNSSSIFFFGSGVCGFIKF